jgi:hypothetical protein
VKLRLTGITPLMLHNIRLADPDDPVVRQISELTAKKKSMTEADRLQVGWLKFVGGLYHDEQAGPYLPATHIFASMIAAGRKTRNGQDVEAGVIWLADKAPLEYDGPRDPEKMWDNGDSPFVDRRMVRVGQARIPQIRPIFPDWSAEIEIDYDDSILNLSDLTMYCQKAGRVGVGDYRRFYGRYKATISE